MLTYRADFGVSQPAFLIDLDHLDPLSLEFEKCPLLDSLGSMHGGMASMSRSAPGTCLGNFRGAHSFVQARPSPHGKS